MGRAFFVLVLSFLLGIVLFSPRGLAGDQLNAWNWFHYWLNARYFSELGYGDLYDQALLAQGETDGPMGQVKRRRSLETYRIEDVVRNPPVRSSAWSDPRWEQFKLDLQSLEGQDDRWNQILLDRGFNGTPVWVSIVHAFDRIVDLRGPPGRWLGRALDPLLVLALALLLFHAVGPTRAAAALGIFMLLPTTMGRFPGSLLQYDVFVLVMASFCLLSLGRRGWAGVALGLATALRLFPAVFVAALLARAAVDAWDGRAERSWLRFSGGVALGLALAVGIGALGPRGPGAWAEFLDNTSLHQEHHVLGDGRVGLEHLFSVELGADEVPRHRVRRQTLDENRRLFRASQAGLFLLLLLAARRRDVQDTFVLACVAFFLATVASRYYWTVLALFPLLGLGRKDKRLLVWGSLVALLPLAAHGLAAMQGAHKLFRWLAVERALLCGLVATCLLFVALDLRRWGLRGWLLRGFPEEP
ncbi:MAG: glycosyltransferase 87 family protein [Myxococcota bacterium]|nr:glycosyltransferase 87 family protein [Myxococcota bacterium]